MLPKCDKKGNPQVWAVGNLRNLYFLRNSFLYR